MADIAMLVVLVSYVLFLVLDIVRPARSFSRVRFWRLKGFAFLLVSGAVATFLPFLWAEWAEKHRLLNLSGLGVAGGAVVGFIGMQMLSYWWHRLLHSSDFMWRWFHQMHHSAERIDIHGALLFHPLDIAGFTAVQSLGLSFVFGVSAEAAALAGAVGLFYSLFQHANLHTPRWLGLVIQRPESHTLHHGRGVHGFNYADFPLWDVLFGTFRNPARYDGQAGFYEGASSRVGAMLVGRNISEAPLGRTEVQSGTVMQPVAKAS